MWRCSGDKYSIKWWTQSVRQKCRLQQVLLSAAYTVFGISMSLLRDAPRCLGPMQFFLLTLLTSSSKSLQTRRGGHGEGASSTLRVAKVTTAVQYNRLQILLDLEWRSGCHIEKTACSTLPSWVRYFLCKMVRARYYNWLQKWFSNIRRPFS